MLKWYPKEDERPLRIAVLCSHRAPGVMHLLNDPRHGTLFEVVACISSEHDFADREAIAAAGVPTFIHDIHGYYGSWHAPLTDLELRKGYDAAVLHRLAMWEPDLIILSSYLYIVTTTLLEAYPQRVINVHHSDLPAYPGLHAVRDAIFAGERETRATAHLVTKDPDAGPVVVRSWGFPVHPMVADLVGWNASKVLRAYAFAHQEWMIESVWGPLMLAAVELFARGELQTFQGDVYISGSTAPLELEPPGRALRSMRSFWSMR